MHTKLFRRSSWLCLFLVACASRAPDELVRGIEQAATVPSGFVDEIVVTGFDSPTAFTFAPDGRMFVAEQDGRIRVVRDHTLLSAPFVTLAADSSSERGLLGITLDPHFAANSFVYVFYTMSSPTLHNRVSRLTASGDVAIAGSETVLLELDDMDACPIHMGGAIHFGADGSLFIAVGDECNPSYAQRLDRLAGKLLRIHADGTIPGDNPFVAQTSGRYRAIWATGFRNPYTFAVSRSGRILINDVGLESWEEINEGVRGANYGWPDSEGRTTNPAHTSPAFTYPHSGGPEPTGCAATGGTFYEPAVAQFPRSFEGKYLFGDYCRAFVRTLDMATRESAPFLEQTAGSVDLDVGPDGSLYRLERGSKAIARVRYAVAQPPSISVQPSDQVVTAGQSATFRVGASGSAPLSYRWQRDGTDIPGASGASHTLVVSALDDGARFRVIVSNSLGNVTSREAILDVSGTSAPTAVISEPIESTSYSGGQSIRFVGSARDAEDGALPASAFTWEVVLHHGTHTHPFIAPFGGQSSGSFVMPRVGHTETDVFYRIHLRVRDGDGFSGATHRDIVPRLTNLTLQSSPPGLQLTLDGSPLVTPRSVTTVAGVERTLAVLSPQVLNGQTYVFRGWSDGGGASHAIAPTADATYVASFDARCDGQRLVPVGATSSSNELPELHAALAIDGDANTRWSSAFRDGEWLVVDLGGERAIERIVLDWEAAYARRYRVEVSSDGASWQQVAARDNFQGGRDAILGLSARGRYLRVFTVERATAWGSSLWEVAIHAPGGSTCAPPRCGDGQTQAPEECDDGNLAAGDGCSATCTVERTVCGEQRLATLGASASSVENGALLPALAIDRNLNTRWSSARTDPQWIVVDLGARRRVARVVLRWERAFARDYRIEVAEAANGPWTTTFTRTGFAGGTDTISGLVGARGRYVRVYATARGTIWGDSLWEIELYGEQNPDC